MFRQEIASEDIKAIRIEPINAEKSAIVTHVIMRVPNELGLDIVCVL